MIKNVLIDPLSQTPESNVQPLGGIYSTTTQGGQSFSTAQKPAGRHSGPSKKVSMQHSHPKGVASSS